MTEGYDDNSKSRLSSGRGPEPEAGFNLKVRGARITGAEGRYLSVTHGCVTSSGVSPCSSDPVRGLEGERVR